MTRWARRGAARGAGGLMVALLGMAMSGCGVQRILGFGSARDGVLLVRHTESATQRITAGDRRLGVAPPGVITCFTDVSTGTLRVEARPEAGVGETAVGSGSTQLTRATMLVLPPDQPLLWDIDHDQVVNGRAYVGRCDVEE
ncbi:MAG: hypothetical protein ABR559_04980 [Gemmatimonadota bacterium]